MSRRLKKIRSLLRSSELDALIVSNPYNRRYLSGFDGTAGLLVIGTEKAMLITDFRYFDQAKAQAADCSVHRWQDDLYSSLAGLVEEAGWKRVGFEAKHVSYAACEEMKEKLAAELVPIEESAERQRMVKNAAEIALLRRGAKILDQAFAYICSCIEPGMCEKEIARELEIYLLRQGSEERSFSFIVASGVRGAMPHGTASEKIVQKGELITIDFGAYFDAYATDMTRTVVCGEPDKRQLEIYDIVKKAQQEAFMILRPGKLGQEVDGRARKIIAEAGYGDYFGHGLGHGVGLETHEQPVLNPRSKTELQPGMVVTLEPGIYIPGWGGVRIEDMVLVTAGEAERLTACDRDLKIIN